MITQILLLTIGVLGLFLGTYPDLFPNKMDLFLTGKYKKMDIAYKKLVDYANTPRGIRETDVALSKDDIGYKVIYGLLRSSNPSLPAFNKSQNSFADIALFTGGFHNTNMDLPMNQVIHIRDSKKNWLPICEMRELYFFIHNSYVRFFTRLGLSFAFCALFIQFAMNVTETS